MDEFVSAIVQCFSVILIGFCAGKWKIIAPADTKGLQTFVGVFSLPAIIFMSLVDLKIDQLDWMFLLSILVSKAFVFLIVLVITLLTNKSNCSLGRAGLFAIFGTQSNDFALGYPIIANIYRHTHPEYVSMIYLMAPISLLVLNPIAFVLLEIEARDKARTAAISSEPISFCAIFTKIVKRVVRNPAVAMTILGLAANVCFRGRFPHPFSDILNVFSAAFASLALFLLGIYIVNGFENFQKSSKTVPVLLILTKLIVLPLIIQQTIYLVYANRNPKKIADLSTYGFLYGTFPVAPSVFVYATQYETETNLIANSMVFCTLFSAPLMYFSGKMITIRNLSPIDFRQHLTLYNHKLALLGILSGLWLLLTFAKRSKWLRIPHRMIFFLSLSQLLLNVSIVLYTSTSSTAAEHQFRYPVLAMLLFSIGSFATKMWTMFLAVTLLFLQCRSLCFILKLQKLFLLIGWTCPCLSTAIVLLFNWKNIGNADQTIDLNAALGQLFCYMMMAYLIVCFIVTSGCLVLLQKYLNRLKDVNPTIAAAVGGNAVCAPKRLSRRPVDKLTTPDVEDLANPEVNLLCGPRFGCNETDMTQCLGHIQEYENLNASLLAAENNDEDDNETGNVNVDGNNRKNEEEDDLGNLLPAAQIEKYVLFIVFMLCSFFINFAYLLWSLLVKEKTGIFFEIEFIDSTLNYGQTIVTTLIFGYVFDFVSSKN